MSESESRKEKGRVSGPHRHLRVSLALITSLAAVTIVAVLSLFPAGMVPSDQAHGASKSRYEVRQSQLLMYCPSQMALADSGKYGDAEFQVSEGNIMSSAAYASFGSIYQSQVEPLGGEDVSVDGVKTLNSSDSYEGSSAKTLSNTSAKTSSLLISKLLDSKEGNGSAGAIASWATSGDLKGLSSASCITPELEHNFLLPATNSGTTHQLVVANPTDKSTSLHIQVWGTQSGHPVSLSTGSTVNVEAHREANVDLSAGAQGQGGLFVKVSSKETPVAAFVRSVVLNGLSSEGSDYALPLQGPDKTQMMAGVLEGDDASISMYSGKGAHAEVSWVSQHGDELAKDVQLQSGMVGVADLGTAPDQVMGLKVRADAPIWVQAQVKNSGSAGNDFAFIPASKGSGQSALTMPNGTLGTLVFANAAGRAQAVTVFGYDATGKSSGSKTINIDAHGSQSVSAQDVGSSSVSFRLEANDDVVWGMRLGQKDVSDANIAAVAYVSPNALEPSNIGIFSQRNRLIAH